jgi:hypothetical protein
MVHDEPLQLAPGSFDDAVTLPAAPLTAPETTTRSTNFAEQLLAASMVTVIDALIPLQAPPHCTNREPDGGWAVSVTMVPELKSKLQLAVVQALGAPLTLTVPPPSIVRLNFTPTALVMMQRLSTGWHSKPIGQALLGPHSSSVSTSPVLHPAATSRHRIPSIRRMKPVISQSIGIFESAA